MATGKRILTVAEIVQVASIKLPAIMGTSLLHGEDLSDNNFEGISLFYANLEFANMRHSSFRGVNAIGATFHFANMDDTDFDGACLRNANLSDASFQLAFFRGADMRKADLSCADFTNADLSDADMRETDLRCANFCGANLDGALTTLPIGMSKSNIDVAKLHGRDMWAMEGWFGNTDEIINRLHSTVADPRVLASWFNRMLSFLTDDSLPQQAVTMLRTARNEAESKF